MSIRRAFVASVAVCVVSLTLATALHAQSPLVDLAAAEAKRRAAVAKNQATPRTDSTSAGIKDPADAGRQPTKVYTGKDLPPGSSPATPHPASASGPVKPGQAAKASVDEDPKQTEAYWRNRMAPLLVRFVADEAKANVASRHYIEVRAAYDEVFQNRPGNGIYVKTARIAALEVDMLRIESEMRPLDAAVNADLAAIAALKEEGRHADAPGWFR